jgi:hypothetical protein
MDEWFIKCRITADRLSVASSRDFLPFVKLEAIQKKRVLLVALAQTKPWSVLWTDIVGSQEYSIGEQNRKSLLFSSQ